MRFVAPTTGSLTDAVVSSVTFAELHQRALSVAAALEHAAEPGDRAVLLCPPGLDYVAALFGCFCAGVVAVPAYPPVDAGFDERLTRLIDSSAPAAILTIEPMAEICEALCSRAARSGTAPRVLAIDAVPPGERARPGERATPARARAAADLALLQYTSGSTGDPRGVMLTHANLIANVASIASRLEIADAARGVFWLPPYHDMGLVGGILSSVVLGGETTLMSPLSFLARPLLWLEAVSRYRGTFSAAPNFAYDLCVRKVPGDAAAALDLSSWKSVVNGAEPVREETMERFIAHFAPARFRRSAFMPAYGLAEATLLVTAGRLAERRAPGAAGAAGANGGPPGASGHAAAPVPLGAPDEDAELLIVDPQTRHACPEREVGEIWLAGPTVGVGYWRSPEASEMTFGATLASGPDGARYLRTGDLGALRGGELHVSGRIKDIIIVRGQNYHPHDIELAASKADTRLRPGCLAAFAVGRGTSEHVALVAEVTGTLADRDAREALCRHVRACVGKDVGIALDELVLIERGASLKTSSGKIRRGATRAAYLEEALPVVARHRWPRAAAAGEPADTITEGSTGWPAPNGGLKQDGLRLPRLARRAPRERHEIVRELVVARLAGLLGGIAPEGIDGSRTFKELGLESPGAVELSALLAAETGLELAPTLCFEHPSPAALASHLSARLAGDTIARRAEPLGQAANEPVAIVGMGCRFPGGIDSPESFWELIDAGADAISEFPRDRGWDLERLFAADPERPGTSHAREAGFLRDAASFDAAFFGITAQQADAIDPQQRLILEVAWEALEDAGIDPASLDGSATAVFVGLSSIDHAIRLGASHARRLEGHLVTGAAASAVSGRLAYTLGLKGAAVTIDTACSSSLVALHQACRALASGECSLALAGGVTVLSTPAVFTGFSRQGAVAPDGRCKPFAAAADGTGFAEGSGLLVLERARDARERGHRVLALVRGSAVNQDGRSNGFTAPSPTSQEAVICDALASAELTGDDVDVVEAHGTGTVLGDPIEARALIATYGQARARPLWLGSVKSNIGHAQAAAGVAGVVKMVLAMRHGVLPKTLHAGEPSPHVDWDAGAVRLLAGAQAWPRGGRPRRAGVSSFGVSGTNAHVILEEPEPEPEREPEPEPAREREPEPAREPGQRPQPPALAWVISARSESALRRQAQRLRGHLERSAELAPLDVAFTLATGRARMARRAAIVGGDRDTLVRGLDALASGEPAECVTRARARADAKPAFVFAGQGSQWDGMGRELLDSSAVFAHHLRACADALSPHVGWSLEDVLRGAPGAPALDRVDVIQPALWAVMVALAELWRAFGVQPSIVVGHSQGEIAAAQLAGGLSLEDAARVVALRGQALREIEGAGDMVSLGVGARDAERLASPFGGRLSLAASNGPSQTVVSGESEALEELLEVCEAEGVTARRIAVGFASHSPQVEAVRERFVGSLAPLRPRSGTVPFLSCVTGEVIDTAGLDGRYWYRALREPVRFTAATRALVREGCSALIEMSPHPVLALPMQETIEQEGADGRVAVIASLRRGRPGSESIVRSLGEAFAHGLAVGWRPLFEGRQARLVALPTYPFERERHWLMPGPDEVARSTAATAAGEHPLLGVSVKLADRDAWVFSGRLSAHAQPWLADHSMLGAVVVPAGAFLEMALHAGSKAGCEEVRELTIEAPLALPEDGASEVQLSVGEPGADGHRPLLIAARPARADGADEVDWKVHARGTLQPEGQAAIGLPTSGSWPPAGARAVAADDLYDRIGELGVSLGPAFRCVRSVWQLGDDALVEAAPTDAQASAGCVLDPALLDAIVQVAAARDGARTEPRAAMPCVWRGVRARPAGPAPVRARVASKGESLALELSDGDGVAVLSVEEVAMRPLDASALRSGGAPERELVLGLEWVAASVPARATDDPRIGVLGDASVGAIEGPRYRDLDAVADAVDAGEPPRALLVGVRTEDQSAAGVRDAACETLALLQSWLAEERLAKLRLVLVTRGAVAAGADEAPSLAGAAVWGVVRSAQSEQPGRFALVDLDGDAASHAALERALVADEPQLALRKGEALVPRLVPRAHSRDAPRSAFDPAGTVLITGGTGQLGKLIALHLARVHGARHLLLASRRGPRADGAAALAAELTELGCEARVVACDVADRAALERLLAAIPPSEPLTAVIHAAGTMDDGLLESLDRERVDRVMAPKADAAIALDELTAPAELSAFVLISSAVATLGGAGQANYAAANAVLDAIAQARRRRGLPAQALAWGLWQLDSGLWQREGGPDASPRADALAQLESQIRARMGMLALEPARGLALFDASLAAGDAFLMPVRMDMEVLRANAQVDAISPVLRGLVPRPRRRGGLARALRRRLLAAPEPERDAIVLAVVFEEVASVLGGDPSEITDARTLADLGGESLGALELRNRLEARTGVRLATRMFFGEPLRALAAGLRAAIEGAVVPARRARSERPSALRALLEGAREAGRGGELVSMLIETSRLRGTFDTVAEPPGAMRLTTVVGGPRLVCVPSFMAGSGPHQFARLAAGFEGRRLVTALHLPGWGIDELAPATLGVAVEALYAAVREAAGGEPYVLVGYSSGGALAHAVAERAEADRGGPSGVVMIDTYAAGNGVIAAMLGEIFDRAHRYLELDDGELIAMGTFLRLASEWRAGVVRAPSLYLRAARPLAAVPDPGALSAPFQKPQSVVSVAADHFTIIEDDARASASAIEEWLREVLPAADGRRSTHLAGAFRGPSPAS